MGGFTSKYLDLESALQTPEKEKPGADSHLLKIDPRSPSDNVSRTPIAVMNTPDRTGDQTAAEGQAGRVIAEDPRSPSTQQVDRTPIILPGRKGRSRPFFMKPSRLGQLDTALGSSEVCEGSDSDPRSPTIKVPRTPLEDKNHSFEASNGEQKANVCNEDSVCVDEAVTRTASSQDEAVEKKNKLDNESYEKVRRPLTSVQNTVGTSTPRGMLQAKQCRNVEEEYNKSQQVLRNRLPDQENVVISKTEFVESI